MNCFTAVCMSYVVKMSVLCQQVLTHTYSDRTAFVLETCSIFISHSTVLHSVNFVSCYCTALLSCRRLYFCIFCLR